MVIILINKVVFYPVDNGDTSLLKVKSTTVVTDLNLRKDAEDDNKDSIYDVAAALREECENNVLSLFVNTHPDQDHVRGFTDLFHTSAPNKHNGKNDDRILIEEIWITPYTRDLDDGTEVSQPFIDEVNRRLNLEGKSGANDAGNRIRVMHSDMNENTGTFGSNLEFRVLAPTNQECEESARDEGNTNNSSLAIRWLLPQDTNDQFAVMLMGDAEREVHSRLNKEEKSANLRYHVLVAPHHMSRTVFSTVNMDVSDNAPDNKRYVLDEEAKSALSHALEPGYVVASSTPPEENGTPPHVWAYDQYIKILNDVQKGGADRILNPASHLNGDKTAPVCFEDGGEGFVLVDAVDESDGASKADTKKGNSGNGSAKAAAVASTAGLASGKTFGQTQIYG